jgi:hypothetical protein
MTAVGFAPSRRPGLALGRRLPSDRGPLASSAPVKSRRAPRVDRPVAVAISRRAVAICAALACLTAADAPASEWAKKMFPVTSHNFGTVARGSKTEYRFVFKNIYEEDLHVVGVRTSCGCTSPTVTRRDLKTHETAEVVATFNTRTFLGQHGATLTVTFDKPFYAEVQLRVAGNIRGDVSFDPPFVDLGNVDLGAGAERTVRVTRLGNAPWQINDVRSANSDFEVSLSKPARSSSQTAYDLTLRLKPDAQAGYVKGQLILVTDDPRATQIPMDVEGRVIAAVTVSPQLLELGTVQPGGTVTKNVVVRANREFLISGISCDDGCLSCEPKTAPAKVHILPITFAAGDVSGRIERKLQIRTDLGEGVVPAVTVQAVVETAGDPAKPAAAAAAFGQAVSAQ